MSGFYDKLDRAWQQTDSLVCVGLDPKLEKLPEVLKGNPTPFYEFNCAIVEATAPYACAYKPQFAYYAAADRLDELAATIRFIRERYPEKVVILDSKRGDIGATATEYALESFGVYGADAVTVNPYMGGDTLEPFTNWQDRGVVVLCKTSNPGSDALQDVALADGELLYERVARLAATEWNGNQNLALVVGATWPEQLGRVRKLVGRMPLLVPGIGAQGGDLEATLRMGLDDRGRGLLINSSRGIIYASGGQDFAEAAGREAAALREACLAFMKQSGGTER